MPDLHRILGKGPYPFPLDRVSDFLSIYANDDLAVIDARIPIDFSPDQGRHAHSDYEFIIARDHMPYLGIGNKNVRLGKNRLLPINSEQLHGPNGLMRQARLSTVSVSKKFMDQLADEIYAKHEAIFINEDTSLSFELLHLLRQFKEEAQSKQPGYQFILDSLATQISVYFLRGLKNNFESKQPVPGSVGLTLSHRANPAIIKVMDFMQESYNQEYSLKELAQIANLSSHHFIRVFKAETGLTPFAYLMDVKINNAKELLKQRSITVTDVCFASGFNSLSHFTTVFRRKVGVTPSQYRGLIQK